MQLNKYSMLKRETGTHRGYWPSVIEPDLSELELVEPEDCAELLKNKNACDKCKNWNNCWGESPWEAARAEYDRSR